MIAWVPSKTSVNAMIERGADAEASAGTIRMGLARVIVAALVGAKGLGTEVMIALQQADPGKGAVAGLSVAFIAIITDRIIQAWVARRKISLGLA